MPVSTSKYREGPYECDGVVTDFTFEFLIFVVGDLDVYLTDASGDTLLVYGTDYEVFSPDGKFTDGGTVRTVQTYPVDSQITIIRSLDILSNFDLTESGKLPSGDLEAAVDRGFLIMQQLAAKIGQGIVLPILEEATMTLPASADRASKFIYFGIDGAIEVKGLAELGAVTADESTIILSADILSIKDGGVNLAKLAQEVIDYITAEAGAIVDIHDAEASPHSGKFEALGAVTAHEAGTNPHNQYARITEDFIKDLSVNGYQKLPSGLIIQWGNNTIISDGSTIVTLPITFPNAILSGQATYNSNYKDAANTTGITLTSTSQITVTNGSSGAKDVFWFVIGY